MYEEYYTACAEAAVGVCAYILLLKQQTFH